MLHHDTIIFFVETTEQRGRTQNEHLAFFTSTEQSSGELAKDKLANAIEAIRHDGYVIIEQVVNHAILDALKTRMDEDSAKLIEAQKWGGAGRVHGHLQQGPPPFDPYLSPDILVNPYAVQISREMLGTGFYCCFYNGNTNTPNSTFQPLHSDGVHLWGLSKTAPIQQPNSSSTSFPGHI